MQLLGAIGGLCVDVTPGRTRSSPLFGALSLGSCLCLLLAACQAMPVASISVADAPSSRQLIFEAQRSSPEPPEDQESPEDRESPEDQERGSLSTAPIAASGAWAIFRNEVRQASTTELVGIGMCGFIVLSMAALFALFNSHWNSRAIEQGRKSFFSPGGPWDLEALRRRSAQRTDPS